MSGLRKILEYNRLILVLMTLTIAWFSSGCEQGHNPVAVNEPVSETAGEMAAEAADEFSCLVVHTDGEESAATNANVTFITLYGEEFDQGELRGHIQSQYGLPSIDPQNQEDLIIANCLLVQAAAEAFAAENDGIYPVNTGSQSAAGHTLIDLLPQGTLLRNPITGLHDSPANGPASSPGQVGYSMIDFDGDGLPNFYHIEGLGKDGITLVFVITTQ